MIAATQHPFAVSLLTAALILGGCSTTPVKYFRGTDTVSTPVANKSLPEALAYLQSARSQYQDAVEAQMRNENLLANSLIGAGALVVALAVGGANTNIVAGTALAAGTAYGFGNFNMPRQRVLIYMAGVEALSCVQKAVAPIYVTGTGLEGIAGAIQPLQTARDDLVLKVAAGRRFKILPTSREGARLTEAMKFGAEVQQAAETTLSAARELLQANSRAAREVVFAVNGIDEAVVKSLVNATPELSAVPGIVSGLAGMSASFAPGAGIDTLFSERLKALSKPVAGADSPKTGSPQDSEMLEVADAIVAAARTTFERNSTLAGLLPKPAQWSADAFKNCGVAEVVSALTASDATLQFAAGVDARQTFEIYGGVKPYFVRLQGPPVDGISAISPIRFDNQAEVSVVGSKVKPGVQASVRVVDSSPTGRSLNIPVVVRAADVPASQPEVPPQQQPAAVEPAANADADLAKLKNKGQFKLDGKTFMRAGLPRRSGNAIELTIVCPDDKVYKQAAIAKAQLAEAGIVEPPRRELRIKTEPASCAPE